MSLRGLLFFVLFALLPAGIGQELPAALPGDTLFALGVVGLEEHDDKFADIVAEAERLELAAAFQTLFGTVEEDLPEAEGLDEEIPEELRDVDWLELFGDEAWLTVSVSSFNPMPAITITVRSDTPAMAKMREALDRAVAEGKAEQSSEGAAALFQFPIDDPESPFQVVAIGTDGGVLSASTNPEVVRATFRQLGGAGEPSLADNPAFSTTVGSLEAGNSYSFIDFGALAAAVQPYAVMTGMVELAGRLLADLGSVGAVGSVTTILPEGFASTTVRVPGAGEGEFTHLLTGVPGASRDPLTFVAADFLGASVTHLDLPGWWSYLGDLARTSPELGNPDLDATVQGFTGLDLRQTLFSWMGTEFATLMGDLGGTVTPGVPSQNLLGNTIYMIEVTDEAAAAQGLAALFGTASAVVAGFTDPTGQGVPQIETRDVAGASVTSYAMGPGISIAHAVVDGWALIATSDAVIDSALEAHADGGQLSPVLGRMADAIPDDASAYSVSDLGATLRQSGTLYASQLQMLAGLTGGEVDFDALVSAGESIEQFFAFLAERAGGSVTYTVVQDDATLRSEGHGEFRW